MGLKVRRAAGAVIFFALVASLVGWLQNLVTPRYDWPEHNRRSLKSIRSAFNEPGDSLDVVFLGTSQTFCAISPMDMYDASGLRGYNLASIGQRVPVAGYLLRGLLRRQSPKLVLIDASGFFYTEEEVRLEGKWEEMVDSLPLSCYREKLDMMREIAALHGREDDREYLLSALLPLLRYHSNYLLEEDAYLELYTRDVYQRKGYVATYDVKPVAEDEIRTAAAMLDVSDTYADDDDARQTLEDCIVANEPYLARLKALCQEHGAQLAFMKVPVCANTRARGYWSANKHDMTQALADRLDVPFYDMCYEDLGLDWRKDSFDGGVHVNHRGARKISAALLAWMQSQYGLESSRDERLDARWKAQSALFADEMAYIDLELETDLLAWLEKVRQGNYLLFTTVSNGLGAYWSDEAQASLAAATGTALDLRDGGNAAYLSVSRGGELLEERHDKRSCAYEGTLPNGLRCKVTSKTGKGAKNGMVELWGTDYAAEGRGIHFVVYDDKLGCVVDSVCFDTSSKKLDFAQETRYQHIMREKLIDYVHRRMKSV